MRLSLRECKYLGVFRILTRRKKRLVWAAVIVALFLVLFVLGKQRSAGNFSQQVRIKEKVVEVVQRVVRRKYPPRKSGTAMSHEHKGFWVGTGPFMDFLFKGFNIETTGGLAGLCITLIGTGVAFEGLRTLRDKTYSKFLEKRTSGKSGNSRRTSYSVGPAEAQPLASSSHGHNYKSAVRSDGLGDGGDTNDNIVVTEDVQIRRPRPSSTSSRWTTVGAFGFLTGAALLHVVYLLIAYVLMLIVMSFNVWVFIATISGIGLGNFIFSSLKKYDLSNSSSIKSSQNTSSECVDSPTTSSPNRSVREKRNEVAQVHVQSQQEGLVPLLHDATRFNFQRDPEV